MAYSTANGAIPASQLTTVERGMKLRNDTAKLYLAMKAEAKTDGYSIAIAYDAGGYRSLWLQKDMHVHPSAHNLSKASSVNLASPGLSSHGTGDRFDLIGAPISYLINLAARYGCTREFGSADPNHFKDNHTWVPRTEIRKTTTTSTGTPGEYGSVCWQRMQLLAKKGGYVGAIDGLLGRMSWMGIQQALTDANVYFGEIDGDPGQLTFTALQMWAGCKSLSKAPTWQKISATNWKKIATKLNTL